MSEPAINYLALTSPQEILIKRWYKACQHGRFKEADAIWLAFQELLNG